MIARISFLLFLVGLFVPGGLNAQWSRTKDHYPDWEKNSHWMGPAPTLLVTRKVDLDHHSHLTEDLIIDDGGILTIKFGSDLYIDASIIIRPGGCLIIEGTLSGTDPLATILVEKGGCFNLDPKGAMNWEGDFEYPVPAAAVTLDGTAQIRGTATFAGDVKGSGVVVIDEAIVGKEYCPICIGHLPVDLLMQKLTFSKGEVKVHWVTANEVNNDHFAILRSSDGHDFQEVARIDPVQVSQETNSYDWYDSKFSAGRSYYRIIQVDLDGRTTEFPLMEITTNGPKIDPVIDVFPIDDGNVMVRLSGYSQQSEQAQVTATTFTGRRIKRLNVELNPSQDNLVYLQLPQGYFIVTVELDHFRKSNKIFVSTSAYGLRDLTPKERRRKKKIEAEAREKRQVRQQQASEEKQ